MRSVTRAAAIPSSIFAKKNNFINKNSTIINTPVQRHYIADASTIIPEEIEKFGKMAERWWDPTGNSILFTNIHLSLIFFY